MAFQVEITELALGDAEEYVHFIREVKKEPESAERWFFGLAQAINSLETLPERCPLIPEQEEFSFEIRHLIYYSHRIVFRVVHSTATVVIYRIYHGSKSPLLAEALA
ncbi:MAG: type II toxin-antitoxin system RelE/ParE family toxin [Acidobacteriota bacterium]